MFTGGSKKYSPAILINFPLHSFFKDKVYFLKILFIYLFIFRWGGKEKERERNINVWLHLMSPLTGDLACKPGMCPDWESS